MLHRAQKEREEKKMSTNKNYLYSFEDVQKQAKDYGFEDSYMSEADWDLARKDPNRGMALVNAKNDWLTAETPEQKAWSHALAEDIRQQGGGYSGGADGSKFVPTGTQQHDSAWEDTVNATVRNLQNRKFEWSPETDPMVKYYEDAYRREGERAMKDTLGAVAATTGGIPSSYATAAAAQQRNYYAQQMTDKYPELYQQAFDRFMQEYDREYQMLDAYMRLDDTDYNRWSDQQERDRNARLDMADAVQREFDNQYMLDELGLKKRAQEHTEAIDWAELGLKDKDMQQKYDLAYAELNQNDRHFVDELLYKYDVMTEEGRQFWAKLAQDGEIADAEIKYKYDALDQDTKNFLMEYALDVDKLEFEKDVHADEVRLTEAEIKLQYDKMDADEQEHLRNLAFSYYELAQQASQWSEEQKLRAQELGIEADKIKMNASLQEWENAAAAAKFGDFSYLKNLGVDTSDYQALWNAQVEGTLNPAEEEAPVYEEELPTEEDVVDAVGENIMKNPTYPSGYDLNAATIDSLAADAPGYKAKSDAENAAYAASPEGKHENHMARYNELENKKGITTSEIVEREDLRKALLIYDDIDNIIDEHNRLKAKHPKTVEETRRMGILERDIRTYNEYFGS